MYQTNLLGVEDSYVTQRARSICTWAAFSPILRVAIARRWP